MLSLTAFARIWRASDAVWRRPRGPSPRPRADSSPRSRRSHPELAASPTGRPGRTSARTGWRGGRGCCRGSSMSRARGDRVVERRRSIALLEAELATKKAPDALSGHWTILLDPGEQKGVFRMTLDGTIVAGEYSLEGGYSGSLRGTLVNDRLKIERVDSKLGFSAVYYGRLARDGRSITGTWQATTFGTGTPGSGRWS